MGVAMSAVRWFTRLGTVGSGLVALAVAGALGGVPAFAAVTTLYVGGANCSDSGPGTAEQPYCTILRGATKAVAGQTVLVAAGTYVERVSVANSGVAGSPIVLRPADGASVTVTGGTNG